MRLKNPVRKRRPALVAVVAGNCPEAAEEVEVEVAAATKFTRLVLLRCSACTSISRLFVCLFL